MKIKQLLPYGLIIAFFAGAVFLCSGFEISRRLVTVEEIRCLVVNQNSEPTGQVRNLERQKYRLFVSWNGADLFSVGRKTRASNGN